MTNANHPDLWRHALPVLTSDIHKYTLGHALIWGGYPMTGAARLAARAAARMGPGLTTIAFDEIALPIYASALISIMVAPIHDDQQIFSLFTPYFRLILSRSISFFFVYVSETCSSK
jgi:ADP-dependent NAD(P)H-hydrate dehydratase / NAD(P)H-hydrate epimerase